jgi:hypothetical protein
VEVDLQADCVVCAVRDLRGGLMEPLKVGDMVMIHSLVVYPEYNGRCTTVTGIEPDEDGEWYALDIRHETHGTTARSRRRHLLKITPPPTLIETEKEMTV